MIEQYAFNKITVPAGKYKKQNNHMPTYHFNLVKICIHRDKD